MATQILKVGVTSTKFVSLSNSRPWVVHGYRDTRGRGHNSSTTQEKDDVLIVEPDDNTGSTSHVNAHNQARVGVSEERSNVLQDTSITKPEENTSMAMTESDLTSSAQGLVDASAVPDQKEHCLSATEDTNVSPNDNARSFSALSDAKSDSVDLEMSMLSSSDNRSTEITLGQTSATQVDGNKSELVLHEKGAPPVEKENSEFQANCDNSNTCTEQQEQPTKRYGTRSRSASPRKPKQQMFPFYGPMAHSTYEKIKVQITPWKKPEGYINKPIFTMMMHSVQLFVISNPGTTFTSICGKYSPFLLPCHINDLLELLQELGCITKTILRKSPKSSLFSTPVAYQIIAEEEQEEDDIVCYEATAESIPLLALFLKDVSTSDTSKLMRTSLTDTRS